MMGWTVFFIFMFGLAVGSFLNVLIYRLPKSLPLTGRSFCPKCKKKIVWQDNIPLISFILLRGHCRFCHSPISWQYPLVELTTGILTFLIMYNKLIYYTQILPTVFLLCISWALIVIFFSDLKYQIIPDTVVFPVVLLTLLYRIIYPSLGDDKYLAAGLLAAAFFLLLFLITKGKGMGFGDVKLALFMGLLLGLPKIIVALYIAFLTGAVLGVILMLTGKKTAKSKIAFGPFLALATLISLFYGEVLWQKIIGVLP